MKFKTILEKDLKVWYGAIVRGFVVFGATTFGLAISQGFQGETFSGALITAGLLTFGELIKYYGIDLPKSPYRQVAIKKHKFLILP